MLKEIAVLKATDLLIKALLTEGPRKRQRALKKVVKALKGIAED